MAADALKTVSTSWTDEQRRAIVARDVSVALSAGAGCGKTYVLTERFLSHLEPSSPNPARLGQLVAITFTERAAREMRDRIRAACNKRLIECTETEAEYWMELLRELDSARISTIHSFCGSLLRSHAVEAGLDPRFSVLDQAQADTILTELTGDYLGNKLADQDEIVFELIVRYGLDGLKDMVAQLLKRRQDIDWPYWRDLTAAELTSKWQIYFQNVALPGILRKIADSPDSQTILKIAGQNPSTHPEMCRRHAIFIDILPKLAECQSSGKASTMLADLREATMLTKAGSKKDWSSEELYAQYKDAAQALRKLIDGVKGKTTFDPQKALPSAEIGLQLISLADGIGQVYAAEKRKLGVLDFNDLMIEARLLLTGKKNKAIRKKWASHVKLLLVDEFQDTDPLQVELVKALCDNEVTRGKLFFVGDFKQSIYRFRGADPNVFRSLREEIPQDGRMPLSLNFRSQPAILEFINALFCEEFENYEPLRAHRPQIGPVPAVEFLWAIEDANNPIELGEKDDIEAIDPQPGDRLSKAQADFLNAADDDADDDQKPTERRRRREADWIARRVRNLLDSGEKIVWDKEAAKSGTPAVRTVQPGDIALLFRALIDVEYYEEALRRHGIDYYLVGGHAFYAQQEVFDLLNLLRAIQSPCDQLSLLGTLRSPFFNLLDETIFWLAKADGNQGDIIAGLFSKNLPTQLTPDQRKQSEFAAKTLSELRAIKDRMPIAGLINEAIERTAYDAILLAEFLGERKLANLYKLIDQARAFDQSGIFTLADFIAQLAEFVARPPDEPLAATQSETMNVVRLMTIHQSKGLEFPVVVVPDISRPTRPSTKSIAFTPELGPLVKDDKATVGYHLYALAEKDETQAETARLLYVAATRAADYLILSSGLESLDKIAGPWMKILADRFDLASGRSLQDDLPDMQVNVTTARPTLKTEPSDAKDRISLKKLLEKVRKKIDKGESRLPKYLADIPPDPTARRQFSFSRLSGSLHERKPIQIVSLRDAGEYSELALDPLGLGTLVHAVLAEIDYANPGDIAVIVSRHAALHLAQGDSADFQPNENGILPVYSPDHSEMNLDEPIELIGRFLASPRSAQIAAADQLHRELEFMLAWPLGNTQPNGRYLQGFVDCLYRDAAGNWHIIDYKTNKDVTAENIQQKASQYEMQMLVYALAVEKLFNVPPIELTLHFLKPGLEYNFPWNEQSKKRIVEMINQNLP